MEMLFPANLSASTELVRRSDNSSCSWTSNIRSSQPLACPVQIVLHHRTTFYGNCPYYCKIC